MRQRRHIEQIIALANSGRMAESRCAESETCDAALRNLDKPPRHCFPDSSFSWNKIVHNLAKTSMGLSCLKKQRTRGRPTHLANLPVRAGWHPQGYVAEGNETGFPATSDRLSPATTGGRTVNKQWQAGDLALCIKQGFWCDGATGEYVSIGPKAGLARDCV
jgi:hypothetical protein